jgi:hypothetical protein
MSEASSGKNSRPDMKNWLKEKGLEAWLKW